MNFISPVICQRWRSKYDGGLFWTKFGCCCCHHWTLFASSSLSYRCMHFTYLLDFQIRVVNAFRLGLENQDSFDKRSLSSMHSQYSIHTMRSAALMVAHARQPITPDDSTLSTSRLFSTTLDESAARVWCIVLAAHLLLSESVLPVQISTDNDLILVFAVVFDGVVIRVA